MTKEETKRRFQAWCQREIGNNCSEEDYAMFNNIMALLEQQPSEDCVSRQATLDAIIEELCIKDESYLLQSEKTIFNVVKNMPPVTPTHGTCKDCKHFDYDSVAKIDGIPVIVAHEICNKWGDGCKTNENGYCFLFERRE